MSTRTIHPFPARMAPDIALSAIPQRSAARLTILDPMCGSGTVLSAALERGHQAVGIDIDPLAVMMSQLAVTEVDSELLVRSAGDVIAQARVQPGASPWKEDPETEAFVDYWFGAAQKAQLTALIGAITAVDSQQQRLALQLAVSRIIVTKSSQASLAADTSHSRPHRVRTESDYDVYAGFERSVRQLGRMLSKRTLAGRGRVLLGDARDLSTIADASVDLAVTSPPYLNALDYLRGHKLALVWFGYRIADLRARRSISIGAERRMEGSASGAVGEIIDAIEAGATDRAALKRPMLERYADDCLTFATEMHRTLKPNAIAVLVVGNSTLRGNYIRNDHIARRAMEHAGFILRNCVEREIPPNRRYMAINAKDSTSSVNKRMRKEVVLTMAR